MATYMVTYDLHLHGQNYECITSKLKEYGTHWHAQGSVWIIKTSTSAAQVRDELLDCLDSNDKLIVAKLAGEAAWFGYPANTTSWLQDALTAA